MPHIHIYTCSPCACLKWFILPLSPARVSRISQKSVSHLTSLRNFKELLYQCRVTFAINSQQTSRADDITIRVALTGDELHEALQRLMKMALFIPKDSELGLRFAQQVFNSPSNISEFLKSMDPLAKVIFQSYDFVDSTLPDTKEVSVQTLLARQQMPIEERETPFDCLDMANLLYQDLRPGEIAAVDLHRRSLAT